MLDEIKAILCLDIEWPVTTYIMYVLNIFLYFNI